MQITVHVDALQNDLAAVAAVGGAAETEAARRIAVALESAFRVRLLDAVSDAAHELSGQLPHGRVEVRLAGGEPSLVFVEEAPEPRPAPGEEAGLGARITLRLPEALKSRVEAAASATGVSVNTWLVQAISRSLDTPPRRTGRHLSGFARS